MSVSKTFRTLHDSNGKRYRFDYDAFKHAFDRKLDELRCNESKKISNNNLYRRIGAYICSMLEINNTVSRNSYCEKIKNWHTRKNGPSDIKEVKLMEEFFDCTLLQECPIEDNTMTTVPNVESNAGRQAYNLISDLIFSRRELLLGFWHEVSQEGPMVLVSGEFKKTSTYFPANYPIFNEVYSHLSKLKIALPSEVHAEAIHLAKRVYGHWSGQLETLNYEGFIDMHSAIDEFFLSPFSTNCKWDDCYLEWVIFVNAQTEEYIDKLNQIFQNYRVTGGKYEL